MLFLLSLSLPCRLVSPFFTANDFYRTPASCRRSNDVVQSTTPISLHHPTPHDRSRKRYKCGEQGSRSTEWLLNLRPTDSGPTTAAPMNDSRQDGATRRDENPPRRVEQVCQWWTIGVMSAYESSSREAEGTENARRHRHVPLHRKESVPSIQFCLRKRPTQRQNSYTNLSSILARHNEL